MTVADVNSMTKPRRWLLPACLIAAGAHAFFYAYCPQAPLSPDEREYLSLGVGLAQNGRLMLPSGDVATRMPLYPAFIAAVYHWQSSELWQNAMQLFQTFAAWCTTIIIALTAERLADWRAGLAAAVIAAFYSPFRFLQMSFLTETLLILLLSLAVFTYVAGVLQARSPWKKMAAMAGVSVFIGLAVLTRANALLLIVPFAVDTVLRGGSARQRFFRVVLILLPVTACAAGWAIRNHRLLGAFTLSTSGGLNFYLGHNPGYASNPDLAQADYQAFARLRSESGLSELQADRRLFSMGLDYMSGHPLQTLVDSGCKVFVWLRTTVALSAPTLLLILLTTLAVSGWKQNRVAALAGKRRLVFLTASVACWPCLACWLVLVWQTSRPWTSPLEVVPIGLLAMFMLRGRPSAQGLKLRIPPTVRGLLIGLFASQFAVAVIFIPIERIRWTVDGLLILAIAVGLSNLCDWLGTGPAEEKRPAPTPLSPLPSRRRIIG